MGSWKQAAPMRGILEGTTGFCLPGCNLPHTRAQTTEHTRHFRYSSAVNLGGWFVRRQSGSCHTYLGEIDFSSRSTLSYDCWPAVLSLSNLRGKFMSGRNTLVPRNGGRSEGPRQEFVGDTDTREKRK